MGKEAIKGNTEEKLGPQNIFTQGARCLFAVHLLCPVTLLLNSSWSCCNLCVLTQFFEKGTRKGPWHLSACITDKAPAYIPRDPAFLPHL